MANPNAKGNPGFGKARGEFYIDCQKDDKKNCEAFAKVWNDKPLVHEDKFKKNSETEKARYTLLDYVLTGAFDKWVKLPDDEAIVEEKILPSIRAKANELRKSGYKLTMRESTGPKLSFSLQDRKQFIIAWEGSKDLDGVAQKLIAKGVIKGDYADADKKKGLLASLRFMGASMMKEKIPLKTDFYGLNLRIDDKDFVEYFNDNKSWATLLDALQEDGLATSEKKIAALKMQHARIEKDAKEAGKESPFTVKYASRTKIKDQTPDLKDFLASLRGGKIKEEDLDSQAQEGEEKDADENENDEDEDEGEVSEEETVSEEDPFA